MYNQSNIHYAIYVCIYDYLTKLTPYYIREIGINSGQVEVLLIVEFYSGN